jgi:hypothetical protein
MCSNVVVGGGGGGGGGGWWWAVVVVGGGGRWWWVVVGGCSNHVCMVSPSFVQIIDVLVVGISVMYIRRINAACGATPCTAS